MFTYTYIYIYIYIYIYVYVYFYSYSRCDIESKDENEDKILKKRDSLGSDSPSTYSSFIENNKIPKKSSLKQNSILSDDIILKSQLIKKLDKSSRILRSLDSSSLDSSNFDDMSVQSFKSTFSRKSNASSVGSSLTKMSHR
jgi:hypothetical protein